MLEGIVIDGKILNWESPLELLFWGDTGCHPVQPIEAKKTPLLVGRNGTGKSLTAAIIEKFTSFLSNPNPTTASELGKLMQKFSIDSVQFTFSNIIHRDTVGYPETTLPLSFVPGDDWDLNFESVFYFVEVSHNCKFIITLDDRGVPIMSPSQLVHISAMVSLEGDEGIRQLPDHIKDRVTDDGYIYLDESYDFDHKPLIWNASSSETMLDVLLIESLKFAKATLAKIGFDTVNFVNPTDKNTLPSKYLSIHGFDAIVSLFDQIHQTNESERAKQELRYLEYPLLAEIRDLCFINIGANRAVEVSWDLETDMRTYFLARDNIQFGHIAAPVFQHPQDMRGFYKIYNEFKQSCIRNNPMIHLAEVEKYEGPLKEDIVKQLTYELWDYFKQLHPSTVSLMYLHHLLAIDPPREDPIPTGIQNLIYMTSKVMGAPSNSIVFIDEPEISLHREIQSQVTHLLRLIRADVSIIFATHSPEVMNSMPECLLELPTKQL